jgi:DNA gyrase subunit A
MIFTNKGRMYRLLVDKVPVGAQTIKGHPLLALVNMEPEEKVAAVTYLYRKTNAEFVIFFTKNGLVKKTPLSEYTSGRKNTGVQVIKFKESDDCVVAVTFVKDEDLMMVTKKGYSIHFTSTDINSVGKLAAGVKGINLTEDDEVVYGLPIKPNKFLAVITVRGIGKLVPIKEFAVQGRGGRGVTIGCNHSGGDAVAGVALVDLSDTLFIVGEPNSITVASTEFPQLTRTSMGNMMIKDSTVTAMIKL